MKKVCVSVMAICWTVSWLFASRPANDPPYFAEWPEEMVTSHKEAFKDAAKLREHLEHVTDINRFGKTTEGWLYEQDMKGFGQKFNVSEEALEAALLDIYRTSPETTIIRWLGFCAGEKGKKVLWEITNDKTKGENDRSGAFYAYIQRADAQQARDMLVRFLSSDMREVKPYAIYQYAMYAFDTADELKREAILASLVVALAQEDYVPAFVSGDRDLAQRNKEYAESSQRLTMLERIRKLPPSKNPYIEDTLKTTLEAQKSRTTFTSVSTNLTELMARDFRKPPEKKKEC